MASTFPGAIDSFTDPLSNSPLNSPSHSTLHSDINDAVEKVEQYMGLVKVIPTSVSSAGGTAATLSATGTVTIGSGNTSVTVNGAFSALYDNYRVLFANTTGSTPLDLRFQLVGLSTASYNTSSVFGNTSSVVAGTGQAGATTWLVGSADTGSANSFTIDLYGPFTTSRTAMSGTAYGNNVTLLLGGQAVDNTSRSAFTITTSTGSITGGTIRVYGYRN